ncbi:MAG: sensor histidine kinase [Acidimicrobiia bacterium]
MTLRRRLALSAVVVAIAVAIGGWLIVRVSRESQFDQIDQTLRTAIPASFRIAPPGQPVPRALEENFSDIYMARVAADGVRTALVVPRDSTNRTPNMPSASSPGQAQFSISTVGSAEGSGRWRAVLFGPPQDQLLIAVSLEQADASIRRLTYAVSAFASGLLLVMMLGGWWIQRLGLRPIAEVTAAADAITRGDRNRRVATRRSTTEAGHLAKAFNIMLDEHQATEDRLRRFVADASHELRTPVASIRAFADLYRQGGLTTEADVADAMRRIGSESARVADLVEDLLLLAKLDEGRPLLSEPVDLAQIVRDCALDVSVTHPSRDVRVRTEGDITLTGDDAKLRQVVANLLDNALVHGGDEAVVSLVARREGDVCVIEVRDDGEGFVTERPDQAFDRFWRGDPARVRAGTGSGLGLSIVRAIIEAHGGMVTLTSAPGMGTNVRCVLPVVPAVAPTE